MGYTTRFAPSPTGYLHLGHAYAALIAWRVGEKCLLRIEDIDQGRCKPDFIQGITEDLAWLGLDYPQPVLHQSQHLERYRAALASLAERELLYPCFCTRKRLSQLKAQSISLELQGAEQGLDAPHGFVQNSYDGFCRNLSASSRKQRIAQGEPYAWRLDMQAAIKLCPQLYWTEADLDALMCGQEPKLIKHHARPEIWGDVVMGRKDSPASYHLAVVCDDSAQSITCVTRAVDLFLATHLHRLLQALFALETPYYCFHPLLLDHQGQRFAKRNHSVTMRSLRAQNFSAEDVIEMANNHAHKSYEKV